MSASANPMADSASVAGRPFVVFSSNSSIGPFEWTSDWSQINGIKIIVIIIIVLLCLGFLAFLLCLVRWWNARKDEQHQIEMESRTPMPAQSDFNVEVTDTTKKISRKKSKGGGEHTRTEEVVKRKDKAYKDRIVTETVLREGPARALDDVPQAKAWSKKFDDKTGKYYYFNRESDEKSWERPAEMDA